MTSLPKLGEPEAPQALRQEPLTVQVPVIVLGSLSLGNGEQIEEGGLHGVCCNLKHRTLIATKAPVRRALGEAARQQTRSLI
jgi:hypothetical protein